VEDAPFFICGHLISLGFMCSILIVSLILKFILWRENQRRDNLIPQEYEQELARCGTGPCDLVSRKTPNVAFIL
jgi:hypothetical protein